VANFWEGKYWKYRLILPSSSSFCKLGFQVTTWIIQIYERGRCGRLFIIKSRWKFCCTASQMKASHSNPGVVDFNSRLERRILQVLEVDLLNCKDLGKPEIITWNSSSQNKQSYGIRGQGGEGKCQGVDCWHSHACSSITESLNQWRSEENWAQNINTTSAEGFKWRCMTSGTLRMLRYSKGLVHVIVIVTITVHVLNY